MNALHIHKKDLHSVVNVYNILNLIYFYNYELLNITIKFDHA